MDRLTKKFMIRSNPRRSQPARLYGLAKVHKKDTPLRLVLSLPRSAYHKIAVQVTLLLSVVDDCQINSSTKCIADILKSIQLDDDEVTQGGGGRISIQKLCLLCVAKNREYRAGFSKAPWNRVYHIKATICLSLWKISVILYKILGRLVLTILCFVKHHTSILYEFDSDIDQCFFVTCVSIITMIYLVLPRICLIL